ncbi:2Fe-2S iron-sulfur cluster-binding protein [Alteraurantiacibacter aquimixticola]|uniref:2Fe-2S iron-sulfur cluster binding domain-containing protein n=1 Tax=Alteraurantiacibacter aquimixticola TaxID=2489173 RepID=A0A4T3F7D0_9SPHN|nr:2Fe-2S iron-sulfur cluster-binding protein [Alteraurantiacibacter aquimixticola]TIX51612.1 2Fe-2S iron-sulfur cluster binding domain-containing protein [Alteraurantiacibacter aquimixticola]
MANVTFSSPRMARDITVYAVAGDRGTILAVAQQNKVPIPFDCQDGNCGSCVVEVTHLDAPTKYSKYGIALTEEEKETLKQLGKITKDEIYEAEVNDMPPRYRLACQCFVRNEDIMVTFEGDETLPAQRPHITHAARHFTGGIKVNSLDEFLGYAVKIEEDAATHFYDLAEQMKACGNDEVAKLFYQLAGFSRQHLKEAQERAKEIKADVVVPPDYVWPDQATPEQTSLMAGDAALSKIDALKAALIGERRGYDFYLAIAETTHEPEVKAMAKLFVQEEAEHLKILEASVTREEWIQSNPTVDA